MSQALQGCAGLPHYAGLAAGVLPPGISERWSAVGARFRLSAAALDIGHLVLARELGWPGSSDDGSQDGTAPARGMLLQAVAQCHRYEVALCGLGQLEARRLLVPAAPDSGSWLAVGVEFDALVRRYCLGVPSMEESRPLDYHPLPRIGRRMADLLQRVQLVPERYLLVIRGRRGSGRDAALSMLLEQLPGCPLKRTVLELRGAADPLEPELSGACAVWDARRSDPSPEDYDLARRWLRRSCTLAVALLDSHQDAPEVEERLALFLGVDPINRDERTQLWRSALLRSGLSQDVASTVSARLALRTLAGSGYVARAVAAIDVNAGSSKELCASIEAGLESLVQPSALRGIVVEHPDVPLDRVITAAPAAVALQRLQYLCQSYGEIEAPGRPGVKALFAGAPGTGKSMAARAIATALGLPLFRVDLAAVVSKWVGETEKNLRDALGAAEASGSVLLFDEGDALFGKRGEVSKGTDRYANMEVAYLLQALELHAGIAIVATNLRSNVDTAFERRFDVTIEFTRPQRRERALIWRQELDDAAAGLHSGVLEDVARRAELAGGNIAAAARFARVLAHGRGSDFVDETDLITAVQSEFMKLGSSVQAAQWPIPNVPTNRR